MDHHLAADTRAADTLPVDTPGGPARVTLHRAGRPRCLLLAGHGAGGGIEARDLVALAAALPAAGVTVGLVEQPWRVAGKRLAPAPPRLDEAWTAILADAAVRAERAGLPLVVAGRSAGARVACRTAAEVGADAVLALAFPLHPPGRPEKSRADELLSTDLPTLVLQGERDAFGRPEEFPPLAGLPADSRLVPVPAADHGFAVPKRAPSTERDALQLIADTARTWLGALH